MTKYCLSSSKQQQANLIPGLNLNALGIFSSGLPVLPAAAGPRGAVPPVGPAGYNPFLVSTHFLIFIVTHYICMKPTEGDKLWLKYVLVLKLKVFLEDLSPLIQEASSVTY